MARLCELALSGDELETRALNASLLPLSKALFLESNPIPVKWALARQGRIGSHLRLPMTELAPAFHAPLSDALRALDLL